MAEAGVRLLAGLDRCQGVGLVELASRIPAHWILLRKAAWALETRSYDLVILVDYPGFNLRLCRQATRRGIPVLYYIAPQLWAWGAWRAQVLRQRGVKIACILPFEPAAFERLGLDAEFVGHPLLDRPHAPSRSEARHILGLDPQRPVVTLLPGSRPTEVERIWPLMRDAAVQLTGRNRGLQVVVAGVKPNRYPGAATIRISWNDAATALAAADVALCKSGTSTLEAALLGIPHAVVYRAHPLTYQVARKMIRVPYLGLVNLIQGREVVPELVQDRATPEALGRVVEELMAPDSEARRQQLEIFPEIRRALGEPGVARRVARLAWERIGTLTPRVLAAAR